MRNISARVGKDKHEPEALQVREGDLHAADVDYRLVEINHEAVGLIFQGLDDRVELYGRGEPAPALVHGAVRQGP